MAYTTDEILVFAPWPVNERDFSVASRTCLIIPRATIDISQNIPRDWGPVGGMQPPSRVGPLRTGGGLRGRAGESVQGGIHRVSRRKVRYPLACSGFRISDLDS